MLLVVLGSVAHFSQSMVRDDLLDEDFYADALIEQRAYRRVYSEILVDPAVRGATARLLGELRVEGRRLADVTAVSNAVLHLALPPATLRRATERAIQAVLAYIRGEVDRLDATVDLSAALSQLDEAASAVLADFLQSVPPFLLDNLAAYERAVVDFVRQLEAGSLPTGIPVPVGAFASDERILAIIDGASRHGLPDRVRDQIAAAVRSGDEAEALVIAAATFARGHLRSLTQDPGAGRALRIDVVDVLGPRAGQTQQQFLDRLDTMRRWTRWLSAWTGPAALGMAAVGAVLIMICSRTVRAGLLVLAVTSLVAGLGTWLTPFALDDALTSPLQQAGSVSTANSLPGSVIGLVHDVHGSIREALQDSAEERARALLAVAAGCGAVAGWLRVRSMVRTGGTRTLALVCGPLLSAAAVPVLLWTAWSDGDAEARDCNGRPELCDRPYDEIVQAATHNSMSSPDVVRIWPEHDGNIRAQLDYGVRTLLIDTHYWTQINTPSELVSVDRAVPPHLAGHLFRELEERLAARPGTFLCHRQCAYGAIPFERSLSTIKAFLDANPDEVVTLIIEDAVSVADTEAAFAASGIEPYLYRGDPSDGWPTLGALIEDGSRLVVFAESGRSGPDWYRPAFESIQDTAFRVRSADDFDCRLRRGSADAPLFLLNHWVHRAAPDRADAAIVNERAFLQARVDECARIRGQRPNFIAVNFFSLGDVMGVVEHLNAQDP